MHLNVKSWAKVYKKRCAVVAQHFVTEVYWEKSENDLIVLAVKLGRQFTLRIEKLHIRKGSDDTWRIIRWV